MNPDEFVFALVRHVHEAAVDDTVSVLSAGPSGRRPPSSLVDLSGWFKQLSPVDRERVQQVVEQAVHSALFGVLCVLDGVRKIDTSDNESKFVLLVSSRGESTLLNPDTGEYLHDSYQSKVYERVFGREP